MEKKVAIYTLGCKVNQYESNGIAQKFEEEGYTIVDFSQKADIYIINTCTVTNISDRKSRQILRRAKQLNEQSIVVAVGCYAQVAKEELKEIEEIDLVLGNNEKSNILQYINQYKKDKQKEQFVEEVCVPQEYKEFGVVTYTEKTRAVIKVQDGCDMFCSYCIIPYARGRIRSRKIESVVKEVSQVAKQGIKEIVITGIHIASYGKDLNEKIRLIDLLEELNRIEGIQRIRLGSLEPTLITSDFVVRLVKLQKICDHFHLSLQSGCDETLKRMNRKYTTEIFRNSVKLLRQFYPNVALTTDIIVGFPGETQEEFEKTQEFLKEIAFYKMHVFKYSPRKGTIASKMKEQIEGTIKEERSKIVIEMSNQNETKYNQQYVGKEVEVLLEENAIGHTSNYIKVNIIGSQLKENKIVVAKILDVQGIELLGQEKKI